MHFTLGHSPDPDDAFMFWAMATEQIDLRGHSFEHILQDIQTLNERATRGELDITAISIHAYAYVLDKYALLPSGSSMGDGYGPMLVAKQGSGLEWDAVKKVRVAIPGTMTTAWLALQLMAGKDIEHEVLEFDAIPAAVERGDFDIGLIIHEGQLTYEKEGLELVRDLGAWWKESTGLPLPLGGNCLRKSFDDDLKSELNVILRESIVAGLEQRQPALDHAMAYARNMETPLADEFVGMYVNDFTVDYGDNGRAAVEELLRRGADAGLLPRVDKLEFVG